MRPSQYLSIPITFLLVSTIFETLGLIEEERLQHYRQRGHKWPLRKYVPDTSGWRRLMERRFEQAQTVEDINERYNAWMLTITSSLTVANFTENGWGVTRAPRQVLEELHKSLYLGMENAREENYLESIGGERPLFIDQAGLNEWVVQKLKPMHEEWSGIPLEDGVAYGMRIYRNNSYLYMHNDRPLTHIISSILHVDHSEDSEPWPIIIEDFRGITNEVYLESGDMLLYESAKCLHGRPKPFKGSWYANVFIHYYPLGWDTKSYDLNSHYAVPPHWYVQKPLESETEKLEVIGTSLKEPGCEYFWCALEDTVKWHGPAEEEGVVISAGGDNQVLSSVEKEVRDEL